MDFADQTYELDYLADLFNLNCSKYIKASQSAAPWITASGECSFSDPGTATCGATSASPRFCCCAQDDDECPLPAPPAGWLLASVGETCEHACGATNCSATTRDTITTESTLESILSDKLGYAFNCAQTTTVSDSWAPGFSTNGQCLIHATTAPRCDVASSNFYQVCCCGDGSSCPLPP